MSELVTAVDMRKERSGKKYVIYIKIEVAFWTIKEIVDICSMKEYRMTWIFKDFFRYAFKVGWK